MTPDRAPRETTRDWLDRLVREWPDETPFDAREVLEAHPELRGNASVVVDLAYEEFCRCREAGRRPTPSAFAARFPEVEASLVDLLDLHDRLRDEASLGLLGRNEVWPLCGETVLDFELLRELGRGVRSRVFLARERALGDRLVVVKVCAEGGHEAALLGRLVHPNIVPVHSVRMLPDRPLHALCMPYRGEVTLHAAVRRAFEVEKGGPRTCATLVEHLAEGVSTGDPAATPPAATTSWVAFVATTGAKLADALAHAHALGVLHCDVKPTNVLLTRSGDPLLLDFNLARRHGPETRPIGGTLPFMAPEQLASWCTSSGRADDPVSTIDGRADVFGLAATLYHALSNATPFGADVSRAGWSLESEFDSRRRAIDWPDVDGSPVGRRLLAVLRAGLAFDPGDRPATMEEMAAALRGCLARPALRGRRAALTATVLAGVVAVAAAFLPERAGSGGSEQSSRGHGDTSGADSTASPPKRAAQPGPAAPGPAQPGPVEPAVPEFDAVAEYAAAVRAFSEKRYPEALDRLTTLAMADPAALARAGVRRSICVHAAIVAAVLADRLSTLPPEVVAALEQPTGDEETILGEEAGTEFRRIKSQLREVDHDRARDLLLQRVIPQFEAADDESRLLSFVAVLRALSWGTVARPTERLQSMAQATELSLDALLRDADR